MISYICHVEDITPNQIITYLRGHGWVQVSSVVTDIATFVHESCSCYEVSVPLTKCPAEYRNAIRIAVGVLANYEHIPENELLEKMSMRRVAVTG